MAGTYAGSNTFPATIAIVDDGDPGNAASFNPGPQGLADRTTYLKAHVDALEAGIRKIRNVADIPALKALTDHQNGECVYASFPGILYQYDSGAVGAHAYGIVKPDDVAGNGRWLAGINYLNLASLPPVLDAGAKLLGSTMHDGGWSAPAMTENLSHSTTSTSFVTIGADLSVSCPLGSTVIEVSYDIEANPPSGNLSVYRIQFTDPAAAVGQSAAIEILDPTSATAQVGGTFLIPISSNGTWLIRPQVKSGNGSTAATPRILVRAVAK